MSADAHEEVAGEPALQCAERALPSAPLLEQQQVLADGLLQRLRALGARWRHQPRSVLARSPPVWRRWRPRRRFARRRAARPAASRSRSPRTPPPHVPRSACSSCAVASAPTQPASHSSRSLKLGEPIHQGDIALLSFSSLSCCTATISSSCRRVSSASTCAALADALPGAAAAGLRRRTAW